jgi:signal transduction histidine kinase
MGLSIAADIVNRHGGELTLDNRVEGGLRVRITLPRD